jgi:hypothetical protein
MTMLYERWLADNIKLSYSPKSMIHRLGMVSLYKLWFATNIKLLYFATCIAYVSSGLGSLCENEVNHIY